MSQQSPDVVVIGGGIVGTAAAAFLVEAGACVTLVEREGLASGASGANSGVIQHPLDPVLVALYEDEGAEIGAAIGQLASTTDGHAVVDHLDFSLMPLPDMATVYQREWAERILRRATDFVPAVEDAPIRSSRACARPQSVDGRPFIGRLPRPAGHPWEDMLH